MSPVRTVLDEFEQLTAAMLDGTATAEDRERFTELSREYPEFSSIWLEQVRLHALLTCRGGGTGERRAGSGERRVGGWWAAVGSGGTWRRAWWKVAAAAVVAATVWLATTARRSEPPSLTLRRPEELASFAQATAAKGVGGLASDSRSPVALVRGEGAEGVALPGRLPGKVRVEEGLAVVRLGSGVELALLGPLELEVRDAMSVRLARGRLLARVPSVASGFTVRTRELEVWDIGTVFGVSAEEGGSEVFVFKGSVQVSEASGEPVDLCEAGQGVRAFDGVRPFRFAADWPAARKMQTLAQGQIAQGQIDLAFISIDRIVAMWVERYVPEEAWRVRERIARAVLAYERSRFPHVREARRSAGVVAQKEEKEMSSTRTVAALATVAAMGTGAAYGNVIDLRHAVRQEPGLIHHYTFEGPQVDSTAMRLLDRAGGVPLTVVGRGTDVPPVTYEQGYDPLSVAGAAVFTTNVYTWGRAWVSASEITLPTTLTVECVVCPYELPVAGNGYVVATRATDAERGYYLRITPDGRFDLQVGNSSRTIVANITPGHWYYVASTFSVNGSQTTVNSYWANLTAGGGLRQALTNVVATGNYGSSAVLGVGVLRQASGTYEYFAPCLIDEVALHSTVLSASAVNAHYEKLTNALPTVEYREIFPNDNGGSRTFPQEGWQAHRRETAAAGAPTIASSSVTTAFEESLEAVASFPTTTGASHGCVTLYGDNTDTNTPYLFWTAEMADRLDVGWLKLVTFDTRSRSARVLRLALRIDSANTPEDVGDDVWYVGADFAKVPGTSAIPVPSSDATWRRHWLDVGDCEWVPLSFVPGSVLAMGESQVALPTNGLVTAFGLYQDEHTVAMNMRFDNFTIYAARVLPPPPKRGTLIRLQ